MLPDGARDRLTPARERGLRAWASEDYVPERFNLDAANAAVAAV